MNYFMAGLILIGLVALAFAAGVEYTLRRNLPLFQESESSRRRMTVIFSVVVDNIQRGMSPDRALVFPYERAMAMAKSGSQLGMIEHADNCSCNRPDLNGMIEVKLHDHRLTEKEILTEYGQFNSGEKVQSEDIEKLP